MSVGSRLRKGVRKGVLGGVLAAVAVAATATPALAWWEADYAYRTKINLNVAAAGITGEVARAPVLVRLHSGNFNFADAKADGSDLRFVAGDDRTPLKFHIERWNAQEQQALVWVDVQGLQAGQAAAIYAYYGADKATAAQDRPGTYGPDYRLVWHFDNAGAPRDATAGGVTGIGGEARNAGGLIGQSLLLDGGSPAQIPAQAFGAGPLSVSFWVKPGSDGQILSIPGAASLVVQNGQLFVEANGARSAGAALATGTWAHVALVNDGKATRLFIGGQPAGEVAGPLAAASGAALLGQGFSGEIDEFRVAGVALPEAAFQLAAASEGQGARLVTTDTAEQAKTGGGHDYFGILFKALTFDAWVVIGVLAVMLAIALWVMIAKGLLISRVRRANEAFLDGYGRVARTAGDHDGLPAFDPGPDADESSLARLYQIGRGELTDRLKEGRSSGSRFAIRAQSIAAIRSALDAGQVRESQRLNARMILLTIAISGGPFIGLLGTVLGVMITFAMVAAVGEVNINAIAPGIAAALLATVAGLAVAIPALFGYNYLLSRVEDITADNQIFVDELEKRIAETWQDVPTAIAAE
ncbi:MotA/TolQ/ExbB proton channel family protein [Caulobacter mirabilis]|uniref:MotA n=1 Tax=Caulobacter mirabilis TaxID=69666 RepID=A0A2D2B2U8_9CAUL|nr:MotA/TolQ/ExbB proton channel family protein [Caulobacter mirabilis]ATQ44568.1 MotA [Caulobacter mirabilis]